MSDTAALIIDQVRAEIEMFENHEFYFAMHLSQLTDPDAAVDAMPRLLQGKSDARVMMCLHYCLEVTPRYREFNLFEKVRFLRLQRG